MSDCYFRKELSDYDLDLTAIDERMRGLEEKLGYRFRDIRNLTDAMCAIKLARPGSGINSKDYYNESLAVVGDSVLKTVLSDLLFKQGLYKGDLTEVKKGLEGNDALFGLSEVIDLRQYAFNEHGFYPELQTQNRPPYKGHNQYFEAIIGAVYYDSDYDTCRSWLLSRFFTQEYIDGLLRRFGYK